MSEEDFDITQATDEDLAYLREQVAAEEARRLKEAEKRTFRWFCPACGARISIADREAVVSGGCIGCDYEGEFPPLKVNQNE